MIAENRSVVVRRLRRIEGQVRGLERMVEEGRDCEEILTQVSAVEQALGGVCKVLLKDHLRSLMAERGPADQRRRAEELIDLMSRRWR